MKKGNLAVLLTFPFVIAFLGVTAIVGRLTTMDRDLTDIEWEYDTPTGFKIDQRTPLNATGVYDTRFGLAYRNNLVWTVKNANEGEEEHARIEEVSNGTNVQKSYYLIGISEGDVVLTVSNEKKTVFKSTTVAIYEKFALFATPATPNSNSNIDPNVYYGEYDIDALGNKTRAQIPFKLTTIPSSAGARFSVASSSMNVNFNLNTQMIEVGEVTTKTEPASFTVHCELAGETQDRHVSFSLVKDGNNVYDYDQLLACTNRSKNGEIVVLRKNFESVEKFAQLNADGSPILVNGVPLAKKEQTALFGHYLGWSDKKPVMNFAQEVYSHQTTMEAGYKEYSYIKKWNAFATDPKNKAYRNSVLGNNVLAGLRVQKDFYGNGYSLNMHDLTYPYRVTNTTSGDIVPTLGPTNLFRGPLLNYCLGDPVRSRIIALYGEDNAGLYLDGDGITVNDLNMRNCDFGNHLSDLDYVGSVIGVHGNDNTIINSRLSSGKSVVRSYSSKNLQIENCMLQNSYNFLLEVGSDEVRPVDGKDIVARANLPIDDYIAGEGDGVQNAYLAQDINSLKSMVETSGMSMDGVRNAMRNLSAAYSGNGALGEGDPHGSTIVKDCLFYHSGVSSIGSVASFNGPYLYKATPSLAAMVFNMLASIPSATGESIIPFVPEGVALNSYPVTVSIEGETEFYDYKRLDEVNLNGLLYQELGLAVSRALSTMGGGAADVLPEGIDLNSIGLDDIFPLKQIWDVRLKSANRYYTPRDSEHAYANMVSFYFGGGPNLTKINTDSWEGNSRKYKEFEEDLINFFTTKRTGTNIERYWRFVWRLVHAFVGYQPFKFGYMDGSGYNYDEAPSVDTLIDKASKA